MTTPPPFDTAPAPTPRTLWIELTSKCAFDCVFCSRKLRRGAGQHLPFPLYRDLVNSLVDPRRMLLNYSGESTYYPELISAIAVARSAGAYVELVSVLTPLPDDMLRAMAVSGLNRLTVSVHATDPELFASIYRYSSFPAQEAKLRRLLATLDSVETPPLVDLAFVAMDRNLPELPKVAALAESLGIADLSVFPLLRRDPIPELFQIEVDLGGTLRPEFQHRLTQQIDQTRFAHPAVQLNVCNPLPDPHPAELGEAPIPYPWPLPAGAAIHTCEQNPWETAHILSNGDVVACEVLDHHPLGNLHHQSIQEIWTGPLYHRFREEYRAGEVPDCRTCPWKTAYRPTGLQPAILAARGHNAQLLHGWHSAEGEDHIWSTQRATAILDAAPGANTLHISGLLPPGPQGAGNELEVLRDGKLIGAVANPYDDTLPFGLDFPMPANGIGPWPLSFRTRQVYRPSERKTGSDQRDLGFALVLLAAKTQLGPDLRARRRQALQPLADWVHRVDHWAARAARLVPRPRLLPLSHRPGVTVVIPERDSVESLRQSLESVQIAAQALLEPVQIVVVVNGTPPHRYDTLRAHLPGIHWRFHAQPLGFAAAIAAGLRAASHDWVYLLNNDACLQAGALAAAASQRAPDVFAVASQIFLTDPTRFRDETNWSDVSEEDGLFTAADRIPTAPGTSPNFYAGGGSSLFQTRALTRLLDPAAYPDFYWEDVEWGWRARKLGYRVLFCAESAVRHTQGATVKRFFPPAELEAMRQRNRILFQLRNWTSLGSLERLLDALAEAPDALQAWFHHPHLRWHIARGRLWSHRAPVSDHQVMDTWKRSISTC